MPDGEQRKLDSPLMSFATDDEVAKLKASDQWKHGSRTATTLLKKDTVTILLIALHAGAVMQEHRAPGPITVAVLEGSIRFKAAGEERVLRRRLILPASRD
jgi:quercetin dioxygenase-like cupin family protein